MDKADEKAMELYQSQTEILGVDSADFITEDLTFIRIQVIMQGRIKVIPTDLIQNIAKLIREYEVKKKEA